jgi:DNA-binding MarR family transcriptional regulator
MDGGVDAGTRSMTAEPDLFETVQCLCLASRRAARAITRQFDTALRPHGIKATQFTLLAALALKGPQPIGALAEFIGVDRTTLTRNLAVAREQSLVRIGSGEDARARVASITARGHQTLRRAFSAWRETQHELSNAIGVVASDSLRRLSRKSPVSRIQRMIAP